MGGMWLVDKDMECGAILRWYHMEGSGFRVGRGEKKERNDAIQAENIDDFVNPKMDVFLVSFPDLMYSQVGMVITLDFLVVLSRHVYIKCV